MILVTGGAGFIGANFVLHWLSSNDEPVLNVDALTYAGNLDNLAPLRNDTRHVFIRGSILDLALIQELLNRYQPRAILNFAAESHVDRSIDGAEQFIQTNIVGTFRLLEASRAYWNTLNAEGQSQFRFLQVSTDEVYGSLTTDEAAFHEVDRYEPNSPYSASKAAADHLVRASFQTHSLPVLTTICANNYGPYQYPEKLIPRMITRALNGLSLPVFGNGHQVRDWLYVKDHCRAICLVLESGLAGETYNVGCNDERSNIDVVNAICSVLDDVRPLEGSMKYSSLIEHVEDRAGHDTRYAIDAAKIQTELGWRADQAFDVGLKETIDWYLRNPLWLSRVQERVDSMSRK